MSVSIVVVSHSPKVAEGAVDMARQMVGEGVKLAWTGGDPDGGLGTDDPALAKSIKARVLAINGADDTATIPDVPKFTEEMRGSPADWQFVEIGHAVHCFTETEATGKTGNCRYDAKAAARSYAMMRSWLAESFAKN